MVIDLDLYTSNIGSPEFFDLEFLRLFLAIFITSCILFLVLKCRGYLGFMIPVIFVVILMFTAFFNGLYVFSLEHAIYDGIYSNKSQLVSGIVRNYRAKFPPALDTFEIDGEHFVVQHNVKSHPYFTGLHSEGFSFIKNGMNLKIWFVVHLGDKFIIRISKNQDAK